jgi:hypothetical protein
MLREISQLITVISIRSVRKQDFKTSSAWGWILWRNRAVPKLLGDLSQMGVTCTAPCCASWPRSTLFNSSILSHCYACISADYPPNCGPEMRLVNPGWRFSQQFPT